jgi:hypothetical protein
MRLPTLTELQTSRNVIDVFKGYNHNLQIGENEFYDMKNLTSSYYPTLAVRGRRGIYDNPENPQGLITKDSLCYVDGSEFVVDGYRVEMGLSTAEEDCPKQLISMGAYVIIMPDKKWINTKDLTDFGSIEATVTTNSTVSFEMCRIDGSAYEGALVSSDAPKDPENMDLWIDTTSTPHTLKQWAESSAMWVSIATTYVKISAAGIGKPFEKYDGVTISGIKSNQLSDLNNTMIIWERGDDYIVVIGLLDEVTSQTEPITVKRTMPNMDFVIESENRIWGCRYGVAANGEVVNEIYASKLGDFKNWNCFMGISTDSYAATVGTDGQFTGAIAHLGYPIFFKENCMHKVYGNYPANYQITTTTCRGVQKGSHKSLAIVNEVLYYKSRTSVCAYDGSLPQEISYALGEVLYSNAVACSHGNKYYISMHDDTLSKDDLTDEKQWYLFVYDTAKGLWHKEDNTRVDAFSSCREELYFIDHYDRKIKTMFGSGDPDISLDEHRQLTKYVEWMAETGTIGTDHPDKKYISKMNIRMSLDIGTRAFFYIQYDSAENWEYLFTMDGTTLRSFTVPIRPKRCDHFKLKIEGYGAAKIFSIAKTIEIGSDI